MTKKKLILYTTVTFLTLSIVVFSYLVISKRTTPQNQVKTDNMEKEKLYSEIAEETKEKETAYDAWFSGFSTIAGTDPEYKEWDYKNIPVKIKIDSYNTATDTISVNFISPKIGPRYGQQKVEVSLKCDPFYVYVKEYDKETQQLPIEEQTYKVTQISFDEDMYKTLMQKVQNAEYKDMTILTYCLNETCDKLGFACLFDGLPGTN